MTSPPLILAYWLSIMLRVFLLNDTRMGLESRAELATPTNANNRLVEGVALRRQGVDPYEGVLYHDTPLTLAAFDKLTAKMSPTRVNTIFVLLDLVTAFVLGCVARQVCARMMRRQTAERARYYADAADGLLHTESSLAGMDTLTQVCFLFHPYVVANCAAKTTTTAANLVLALFVMFMLRKNKILATAMLALATYQGLYPIMLIVPLCLIHLEDVEYKNPVRTVLPIVTMFTVFLGGLLYASYLVMGESLSFLGATYGFILSVPELTPNMGLFWYFFTEMFEHFRVFFVCTFQINVFFYVIPLAIRLRKDPFLLTFSLLGLTAIFKSYPSYGDVGFYMCLLPMVKHLFPFTKQLFIVANMFVATTVLGPLLYHLWIYNGSANANYFFAINLVFGTAQIFLVTDLLFAYLKREFYLVNGYKVFFGDSEDKQEKGKEQEEVAKKKMGPPRLVLR